MTALWILFWVLLIVLLVAAWPAWPHSRAWGYGPAGGIAAIILVFLALWWLGIIVVAL
ncbi:MAG: DUF3309 domain-containing protein [Chloroflexi bacterium]|nr:DUF3309 domain-containing protein [Chloroflexota bacterium]